MPPTDGIAQGLQSEPWHFASADENDWLRCYDVDAVNAELAAKRAAHAELVERGEFWEMDAAAREAVSPETHQVQCALPTPRGCALLLLGFSERSSDFPSGLGCAKG